MEEESYLLNELTPSAQLRIRSTINNTLVQDGHVVSVVHRDGFWWLELGVAAHPGDVAAEAKL